MATNINNTVNTVLQIISDLRGESSTNTDANRIRAVSRANKDFALRKLWNFYLMKDQTTVGDGTNDYTIGSATYPMRHKGLTEVFVSTNATTQECERFDVVEFSVFKNLYNRNNAVQIAYTWYDKANDAWKMHISPAPEATETITYSYYWEPPTLTATTDYCVCPLPKVIALLASAEIHEAEDERNVAKEEKNEAEMLLNEIIGTDNMPNRGQLYSMGSIENAVSANGIGNY